MIEFIQNLFVNIFGNNVVLATILIAIVPVIELRGAIPFAMAKEIWGSQALSTWVAFAYGVLGSSIIVPILALIYKPIIAWLKKTKLFAKIGNAIENRVKGKTNKLETQVQKIDEESQTQQNLVENQTQDTLLQEKKKARRKLILKLLFVFSFVALPLPLTGVWTGTCIAVAIGLNFWWTCGTVIIGNATAGLIMTLISILFGDSTMYVVYGFLAIVIVFFAFVLIRKLIRKAKQKKLSQQNQE